MIVVLIGTVASSFYGFRADLIKELVKKNVKVYAFTIDNQALELKKIQWLGAIPVVYSLNRGSLNPLSDLYATYKLSKQIKELKPDLVHSHIFYSHVLSRILKPLFGYTLICSEHGSISPYTKIPKLFFKINNFLKKQSNLNTNVCKEAVQSYIDYGFYKKNEIVSVYNGVNFTKFSNLEDQVVPEEIDLYFRSKGKIFLSIGRLSSEKNFSLLIQAFSKYFIKNNVDDKLLIIGEGKEKEKLKKWYMIWE